MSKNHDIIEIEVRVKHETDKAWMVESIDTGRSSWVPKSVGELDMCRPTPIKSLQLPEWMAEEKGLI